jgi:hypothetical protein
LENKQEIDSLRRTNEDLKRTKRLASSQVSETRNLEESNNMLKSIRDILGVAGNEDIVVKIQQLEQQLEQQSKSPETSQKIKVIYNILRGAGNDVDDDVKLDFIKKSITRIIITNKLLRHLVKEGDTNEKALKEIIGKYKNINSGLDKSDVDALVSSVNAELKELKEWRRVVSGDDKINKPELLEIELNELRDKISGVQPTSVEDALKLKGAKADILSLQDKLSECQREATAAKQAAEQAKQSAEAECTEKVRIASESCLLQGTNLGQLINNAVNAAKAAVNAVNAVEAATASKTAAEIAQKAVYDAKQTNPENIPPDMITQVDDLVAEAEKALMAAEAAKAGKADAQKAAAEKAAAEKAINDAQILAEGVVVDAEAAVKKAEKDVVDNDPNVATTVTDAEAVVKDAGAAVDKALKVLTDNVKNFDQSELQGFSKRNKIFEGRVAVCERKLVDIKRKLVDAATAASAAATAASAAATAAAAVEQAVKQAEQAVEKAEEAIKTFTDTQKAAADAGTADAADKKNAVNDAIDNALKMVKAAKTIGENAYGPNFSRNIIVNNGFAQISVELNKASKKANKAKELIDLFIEVEDQIKIAEEAQKKYEADKTNIDLQKDLITKSEEAQQSIKDKGNKFRNSPNIQIFDKIFDNLQFFLTLAIRSGGTSAAAQLAAPPIVPTEEVKKDNTRKLIQAKYTIEKLKILSGNEDKKDKLKLIKNDPLRNKIKSNYQNYIDLFEKLGNIKKGEVIEPNIMKLVNDYATDYEDSKGIGRVIVRISGNPDESGKDIFKKVDNNLKFAEGCNPITEPFNIKGSYDGPEIYGPFSDVIESDKSNGDIYNETLIETIKKFKKDRYNDIIIAYGQSGSGKSYTLLGKESDDGKLIGTVGENNIGMLQYSINTILDKSDKSDIVKYINIRSLQLYQDNVYDALAVYDEVYKINSKDLVRKSGDNIIDNDNDKFDYLMNDNNFNFISKTGKVFTAKVDIQTNKKTSAINLSNIPANSQIIDKNRYDSTVEEILKNEYVKVKIDTIEGFNKAYDRIINNRPVRKTKNNPKSSRSHLFIYFDVFYENGDSNTFTIVDLAGTETITTATNNINQLQTEGLSIVKNLNVVTSLFKGLSDGMFIHKWVSTDEFKNKVILLNKNDLQPVFMEKTGLNSFPLTNEQINNSSLSDEMKLKVSNDPKKHYFVKPKSIGFEDYMDFSSVKDEKGKYGMYHLLNSVAYFFGKRVKGSNSNKVVGADKLTKIQLFLTTKRSNGGGVEACSKADYTISNIGMKLIGGSVENPATCLLWPIGSVLFEKNNKVVFNEKYGAASWWGKRGKATIVNGNNGNKFTLEDFKEGGNYDVLTNTSGFGRIARRRSFNQSRKPKSRVKRGRSVAKPKAKRTSYTKIVRPRKSRTRFRSFGVNNKVVPKPIKRRSQKSTRKKRSQNRAVRRRSRVIKI